MDGKILAEQFLTCFYNDTVFGTRPLVQDILKKIIETMPSSLLGETSLTDEMIAESVKIIGENNKEIASQIVEFEKLGENIKKSLVTDRGL